VSDLVRFELSGVPCAIRLSAIERILPASEADLDLASALGLPDLGPVSLHERALSLDPEQPALRVGANLDFVAAPAADTLPPLALGHPWIAGVLLVEGEAPILELRIEVPRAPAAEASA